MKAVAPPPTPTTRALTWCLHLLIVALLALAAARAVIDGQAHAGATVGVAALCAAVYAAGPVLPVVRRSARAAAAWLAVVGAVWLALLALSADAVWVAFPLFFLQLHLLSRRAGLAAVVLTTLAAIAGFSAHQGSFSLGMAIGPALGAAVAAAVVWGYQALYRESEQRRRLIEELTATRADLARAQHTAGVLAERERLAREIHDTLAQGLSSIQLLLRAAERALPSAPENATRHIDQARQAAVDNLAEARRFVAALTPPALEDSTLAGALERLCATTSARHPVTARFRVTGDPTDLPTAHDVALLRIAQSALANTVRHAHATTAEVTLSYLDDLVALDVVDNGTGFDPADLPAPGTGTATGGFGLAAMRTRMRTLGGTLTVDSAPGHGTALAARLPLSQPTETEPRGPPVTDKPIRLLLADDHPVVRAGLRAVLETEPGLAVVAESATAEEAVTRAGQGDIDVVLMDLQFGKGMGGAEATAQITARPGAPRVLIVTTYDSDADTLPAIEAGATGYLLKDAPPEDLAAAVRTAAAGRTTLAPTVADRLMNRLRTPATRLTRRETEVLSLVADGLSNQAIGRRLHLTEGTVKSHLVRIYAKLGTESRTAAVATATDLGLIRR